MSPRPTRNPRYFASSRARWHFRGLAVSPALRSSMSTLRSRSRWSSRSPNEWRRHPGRPRRRAGGASAGRPSVAGRWREPRASRRGEPDIASAHWGWRRRSSASRHPTGAPANSPSWGPAWTCIGPSPADPTARLPAAWGIRRIRRPRSSGGSRCKSGGCHPVLGPWLWGWTMGCARARLPLTSTSPALPLQWRVAEPLALGRAAAERWFLGRTDLMVKDLGPPGERENTSENWPTRCCNSFFWAAERWGLTSTTTGVVVARAASWVLVPTHCFRRFMW